MTVTEPRPEGLDEWLASPDTEQLFANALIVWEPTAKPNEYVAAWRRTLAVLLLSEVRARLRTSSEQVERQT